MNLTETDAREKQCCGPPACGANHFCVASKCMGWRWHDGEHETAQIRMKFVYQSSDPAKAYEPTDDAEVARLRQLLADGFVRHKQEPYRDGNGEKIQLYTRPWGERRTGFCGLAEPRLADVSVNQ